MFRSMKMGYYSLVMPHDSAWQILNELGQLSSISFIDQNVGESTFHRHYSGDIKKCDDVEIQLKEIETHLNEYNLEYKQCENVKEYLNHVKFRLNARQKDPRTYINEIEATVNKSVQKIREQFRHFQTVQQKLQNLREYQFVLEHTSEFLGPSQIGRGGISSKQSASHTLKDVQDLEIPLMANVHGWNYFAGTIEKSASLTFKRIVFRSSQGNCMCYIVDIPPLALGISAEDIKQKQELENQQAAHSHKSQRPTDVETVEQSMFLIIYQGGNNGAMKAKLNKICDSFGATKFALPDFNYFDQKIKEIKFGIEDSIQLKDLTGTTLATLLNEWTVIGENTNCSLIEDYKLYALKEKLIYFNMNLFKRNQQLFVGYFWCPESFDKQVAIKLNSVRERSNFGGFKCQPETAPQNISPPSHFKTNTFTAPFQEIVNTYGIPRYGEVNPGLFAIPFFTFSFGVMFGDIGHGGLLLTGSSLLCIYAPQIKKTSLAPVLAYRYLLLMMGVFALFSGFLYNEFFSIPWNLFGSCYETHHGESVLIEGCVYPFGFDPQWFISTNELNFFNSFKMKFAVIYGVSQMMIGILLKGVNCIYFGSVLDFLFEFIPQIVFMTCTFVYMSYLIIAKWLMDWRGKEFAAPSIINQMINLPLRAGSVGDTPLWDDAKQQEEFQLNLLIISVACVPLMLLVKPIVLWIQDSMKPQVKEAHTRTIPDIVSSDNSQSDFELQSANKNKKADDKHQPLGKKGESDSSSSSSSDEDEEENKSNNEKKTGNQKKTASHQSDQSSSKQKSSDDDNQQNDSHDESSQKQKSSSGSGQKSSISKEESDDEESSKNSKQSKSGQSSSSSSKKSQSSSSSSSDNSSSGDEQSQDQKAGKIGVQQDLLVSKSQQEASSAKDSGHKATAQAGGSGHGHGHGEEFQFGEIFVHQVIETIEFVLGSISNTASYLRLWALSLAHAQLSQVFFQKTIGGGIETGSIISIMIGWYMWIGITLCVIMGMDIMECFLHALRLQWIEFQNKFFKADGYKFVPFSFINALNDASGIIANI